MGNFTINYVCILNTLSNNRQIFHSEADFQLAFAWELQKEYPDYSVRLERPCQINGRQAHIDIWASSDSIETAIELKYKTRKIDVTVDGESYTLKDHSAQDCGRYDFLVDIQRIESLISSKKATNGCAIILSNDSSYWKYPRNKKTIDADFRIHSNRKLSGILEWSPLASPGTTKNREEPIIINGNYLLQWEDYSRVPSKSYSSFKYLVVESSSTTA